MKYIVLAIIFLLIPISVLAEYETIAKDDFQLERGTFNDQRDPLTETAVVSKSLTDPKFVQLVGDLDSNGLNEIVVVDDDDVRIYQNNDLDIISTFDYGAADELSNVILFDIDGDSNLEIIFVQQVAKRITVLGFFNQSLVNESEVDLSSLPFTIDESVINCRDANECLLVYSRGSTVSVTDLILASPFNSSDNTGVTVTLESSASVISQTACLPKIRHMEVADLTNDGDDEFIVNYMHYLGAGNDADTYTVKAIDMTTIPVAPTVAWTYDNDASDVTDPGGSVNCNENVGKFFSPPIALNMDPNSPTELEVVFARMSDDDEYDIIDLNADGSELDTHPAGIDSGSGVLISNVFKGTFLPSGNTNDVCVVGFDDSEQEITMICGSKSASELFESYEYTVDVSGITPNFNVTQTYLNYNVLSHSTQQSNKLTEGVDISEVLNTYGVFRADFGTCNILGNCDMELLFLNGCGDSVATLIDYEEIGSTDLICRTSSQLTYIDDLLSNAPATITQVSFDPCITDSIVKVNETLEVTVTVTDGAQGSIATDLTNRKITAYKGTANEVVDEVNNVTSGSAQTQFILLNATGNSQTLQIEGWDNGVPGTIDTITQTFSVGNNGLQASTGQSCTLNFQVNATLEEGILNASIREVKADNTAVQLLSFWHDITGLGAFLGWLFLMLVLGLVLFISPVVLGYDMRGHFGILAGVTFGFEMILLIIGVGIGAINIAGLVVILLIMAGAVGIAVSRVFQESRTL